MKTEIKFRVSLKFVFKQMMDVNKKAWIKEKVRFNIVPSEQKKLAKLPKDQTQSSELNNQNAPRCSFISPHP